MLTVRYEEALVYATQLHANQTRKGTGVPYVAHLLAVSSLVLEHGGDEDEAIAALLHDAIEDQGGDRTRQEIRARFGERIANIVDGVTDTDEFPKPPWRERKEAYLQHLAHASPSELLVSAADKLHNARGILSEYRLVGDQVWERFRGGKTGTLWYYRSLVNIFMSIEVTPLVKEFVRVVEELERLVEEN